MVLNNHSYSDSRVLGRFPGLSLQCIDYHPNLRMHPHVDLHSRISLVLSGSSVERVGKSEAHLTNSMVLCRPCGVVHSNQVGSSGLRVFTIIEENQMVRNERPGGRTFDHYEVFNGGPIVRHLIDIYRRVVERPASSNRQDLELSLDRLRTMLQKRRKAKLGSRASVIVEDAANRLYKNAFQSFSVRDIAADHGVHPVYLARIFRRSRECSMSDYVRRFRISAAAHLLATTDLQISKIARESGFCDSAHLCRQFKKELKITPMRYRKLMLHEIVV